MTRRYGTPPHRNQGYRLRPGAYALLLGTDGRVLLTEQTTPDFTEVQLPGGGIDPGESPVPALTREVLEETGYRCRIRRRLGAFRHFTYMVEYGFFAEKLCHVYLGQVGTRLSDPREAGHRALWVAQHAAADLIESEGASAFAYAALSRGV